MIPRYQVVIFSILVMASLAMGGILWHLRQRAHERLAAGLDSAPTKAPEVSPAEKATLMVANDDDNSLLAQVHSLPLPSDPGARARAVLGRLLEHLRRSQRNPPCSRRRKLRPAGVFAAGSRHQPQTGIGKNGQRHRKGNPATDVSGALPNRAAACGGQPDE